MSAPVFGRLLTAMVTPMTFDGAVDLRAALDLLRSAARATGRTVDDLAEDVLAGRLDPAGLRPAGDDPPDPGD